MITYRNKEVSQTDLLAMANHTNTVYQHRKNISWPDEQTSVDLVWEQYGSSFLNYKIDPSTKFKPHGNVEECGNSPVWIFDDSESKLTFLVWQSSGHLFTDADPNEDNSKYTTYEFIWSDPLISNSEIAFAFERLIEFLKND